MLGVRSDLSGFADRHSMDPSADVEAAALWWDRLSRWEQDDVQAWWRNRSLPFPLSAGLKQAACGLVSRSDPAETMTDAALAFLTTHVAF
jgi:hypothetical protein